MITVSNIREYLYCPGKVYLGVENSGIESEPKMAGKIFRSALIGFNEILQRNLWGLNGKLDMKEILNELLKDVPEFLDNIYQLHFEKGFDDPVSVFTSLKEDLRFNAWIIALKTQKILSEGMTSSEAINLIFPPCFHEFKIENRDVGLVGKIDKIEIVDGVYYPVKILRSIPPSRGVWKSDAIQIAAYSFLLEEEFNKEVSVGFIYYLKFGYKKPVINSSLLNKEFIKVFNEISAIIYEGKKPDFNKNIKKCRSCEYSEVCDVANELYEF